MLLLLICFIQWFSFICISFLRSLESRCMSLGQNPQATSFQRVRQRTGIISRMRVEWGASRLLMPRHQGSVTPSCNTQILKSIFSTKVAIYVGFFFAYCTENMKPSSIVKTLDAILQLYLITSKGHWATVILIAYFKPFQAKHFRHFLDPAYKCESVILFFMSNMIVNRISLPFGLLETNQVVWRCRIDLKQWTLWCENSILMNGY